MKVKQLIKLLSTFDPNGEVILQKDSEGNGYSPVGGANHDAIYIPKDGNVYSTFWTADDACMSEIEWKKLMRKKRCVVLFPDN